MVNLLFKHDFVSVDNFSPFLHEQKKVAPFRLHFSAQPAFLISHGWTERTN